MTSNVHEQHLAAWRGFITAHARLIEQIDQELAAAECVPLLWYDVLVELIEAEDKRLRMSELADRVVLSRSTLTHLVGRMERAGMLVRERAGDDRRGAFAVLTEQGEAALRKAWPIYAGGISAHFAEHLDDDEARTLAEAFTRMLTAARVRSG